MIFTWKFVPKIDRKLPEKQVEKVKKNLPEAFPEYPEIASKPVSGNTFFGRKA